LALAHLIDIYKHVIVKISNQIFTGVLIMKASFKLVFIVMLFVALITGCKKNQTSENPKDNSNPIDLQKIESLVKYCTSRVNSPVKTTDSIPADSLQFYLTATANYTYGIASAHGELQKIDSNFFKVPCLNNKIAMTDVSSIYSTLVDSVRATFRRIQDQNKNLLVVSTSPITIQSNKALFKVTSVIIYGSNYQVGLFDTTDYWKYRGADQGYGGKCGPYYGQGNPYLDAAVLIQNHVMLRKGTSVGCYVPPFTDVPLWPYTFTNPYWNSNDGYNYFRYCFFLNSPSYPNFHDCLWPWEMNRYLGLAEYCVYTVNTDPSGARPNGSSFMSIQLHGELVVGGGLEVHKGWSHYGIYLAGGYQSPL